MCLHCRTERWGTDQGENVSRQWRVGSSGAETPTTTSSPPCKTHTAVNQLCEGAVGAPAAPFFLQLWYWSQEVVEGAGTPGALPGTGIFQLHVPLLSSVCPCSRGVGAQPVRHRGRACHASFEVFVLKRANGRSFTGIFRQNILKALWKRAVSARDGLAQSFSEDAGMQLLVILPMCCLKLTGFPGGRFYLASPVLGLKLKWEISVT